MSIIYTMDEELLKTFREIRNVTEQTMGNYGNALNRYREFNQMTLQELLIEADFEEEERIRWKKTKLRKRLLEFRSHLVNEGLNKTTITHYFTLIKAIYHTFGISIGYLPPLNTKNVKETDPLFFKDLPTPKVLSIAMSISKPLIRAWIPAQSSSGLANIDLLKMTIKQYIEITKEFHKLDTDNIYEVIMELERLLEEGVMIVPIIFVRRTKTGVYHFTFFSPEAVHEINKYLLSRTDELTLDSPLFKIGRRYLNNLFEELNDELGLGYRGKYRSLTPYMLRKYNSSYIKLGEIGLDYEKVNALQGRTKPGSDPSYFFDDLEDFRNDYIKALPNLLINWEFETLTVDSMEVKEIKKQNEELKREIENQHDRISDIVHEELKKYGLNM